MDKLIEIITVIRNKFMLSIIEYTDPGYIILKKKTAELSQEESEFVQLYENTLSLHILSTLTTVPSTICYMAYFLAMKETPPNEKKIIRLKRRLLFMFPLSIMTVVVAHAYQGMYDINTKLKQIQQYYNENKDKDVNSLKFEYTMIQNQ